LDSLEKVKGNSAQSFPLHAKYVPAILAAKAVDGNCEKDANSHDDNGDDKKPTKSKPKPRKKKASKSSKPHGESDWQYGKIRTLFIQTKKKSGLPYKKAAELWDESDEKTQLLSLVSLGELKKRRFLERGATENPWLKKLKGSA